MGRRRYPAPRFPMTDLSPDLPSSAARAGRLLRQIAGVAVSLAFTFLGLLLVTFIIARVVPIDPVLSILGDRATDAQIAAERLRLGLVSDIDTAARPRWPLDEHSALTTPTHAPGRKGAKA